MENKCIHISQRYKSSTRIDSELLDYKRFIDDFILHGTAISVLDTISRDYEGSEQRVYTLTGPYGSGKSTIALYLSSLLSTRKKVREYAADKLIESDSYLTDFSQRFNIKNGWKVIKHVCGLESPANAILTSIYKTLDLEFDIGTIKSFDDEQCLEEIKAVLSKPSKKSDGTLIFLDEMGKALDYQSRANKDLHFFQSLADIAQQAKGNVLVFGFLHQSFSDYAKNKDVKAQKEWAKVQGRYRDLSFNPSIDESLVLVGDSITKTEEITSLLESKYQALLKNVLGFYDKKNRNVVALTKTLPLDPLVSLLLGPISRRRFSQNERSLFGFLASHEKLGFREFLSENYSTSTTSSELYKPERLWDYLHYNLHHLIVTSHDSKAWLEGCDAIYRAEQKGGDLHVSITKVIALLTIFGFQHHLHAKKEFILAYFASRGEKQPEIEKAIAELETWTVIIYRQKHDALFVFQGSDIDIHSMVVKRIESVSKGVDWTSVCDIPQNILATAHYHKTGTMRWANTKIVNKIDRSFVDSLQEGPLNGASLVSFILPASETMDNDLLSEVNALPFAAIGKPLSLSKLKSVAIELIALEQIAKEESKIEHDLIAKKELETRIQFASQQVNKELFSAFETASWLHLGKTIKGSSLSQIASTIAEKMYDRSPKIINELVNRSKPSGSANSAIRKLIVRMVDYSDEKDLGFDSDSFPPEKGLYLSCLVKKGLHSFDNNNDLAFFTEPTSDDNDLKELFDVAIKHLKKNKENVVHLSDIYNIWMEKPFGVSRGILPIWSLALLLANTEHLAFYDKDVHNNDIFIAQPDEEFAIKLIKEPQSIGVKFIEIDGIKLSHLNSLSKAINSNSIDNLTLELAREYVQFVSSLSPWTKRTKSLPMLAKGFRDLTLVASDPTSYLVTDIPKLFDSQSVTIDVESISDVINQLRSAHTDMIKGYKNKVLIDFKPGEDLTKKCKQVIEYTSDYKLETFAMRLSEIGRNDDWVSSIISLLSGVAERNWNDMAIEKAFSEFTQMSDKFKVASHYAVLDELKPNVLDKKFKNEMADVIAPISSLEKSEQRAILLRILESLDSVEA